VPTFLLPPFVVREVAASLYHDDAGIVRSCHGVERRRAFVEEHAKKICVVLPWNARSLMGTMDRTRVFPSQSETSGGRVGEPPLPTDKVWTKVETGCRDLSKHNPESVRHFDGRVPIAAQLKEQQGLVDLVRQDARGIEYVSALPDCWVWVSNKFLGWKHGGFTTVRDAIAGLCTNSPAVLRSKDLVSEAISDKQFRIVTVSRARFNPRFRGRLLVTAADAKRMHIHAVLCIAMSQPLSDLDDDAFQ
jgi:hypothetical protein